jgi:hypothetical protein
VAGPQIIRVRRQSDQAVYDVRSAPVKPLGGGEDEVSLVLWNQPRYRTNKNKVAFANAPLAIETYPNTHHVAQISLHFTTAGSYDVTIAIEDENGVMAIIKEPVVQDYFLNEPIILGEGAKLTIKSPQKTGGEVSYRIQEEPIV